MSRFLFLSGKSRICIKKRIFAGGWRGIRTPELIREQIYSLPPLATWLSTHARYKIQDLRLKIKDLRFFTNSFSFNLMSGIWCLKSGVWHGADTRIWTEDLPLTRRMLYRWAMSEDADEKERVDYREQSLLRSKCFCYDLTSSWKSSRWSFRLVGKESPGWNMLCWLLTGASRL